MTLKLLIIDDEELIREGIASLDWSSLDIEVAATAENGEQALALAKSVEPDIIISDIRMPKKDGIWLAENIKTFLPHIQMIFLTGYNEFEYAKKAISFGVYEYLLKPIDEDELFSIVKKLKQKIEQQKNLQIELKKFKSALNESRYFLKSWFLRSLSENNTNLEFFGISQPKLQFAVLTIKFEDTSSSDIEDGNIFVVFKNLLNLLNSSEIISFYDNELCTFILQFSDSLSEHEIEDRFFNTANDIKEYLDRFYEHDYTIGIGFIARNRSEIGLSYSSACKALHYNYHLGQKQIIYIKDIETNPNASKLKISDEYINAIKVGDKEQVSTFLARLFENMRHTQETLDNQKRICLEIIVSLSRAIYEAGLDAKILFDHTDVWSVVNKCGNTQELYDLIWGASQIVISQMNEIRKKKNADIIDKVKRIVDKNYASGASLENIASQIYLSPCYLSVIFSKETKMTFKDYLIQTRINKAKELLKNTDMKIYEIAEKVGYGDTRYFSDLFRRFTNQTPSQFRSNI